MIISSETILTLSTLEKLPADDILENVLYFPQKKDLAFRANCFHNNFIVSVISCQTKPVQKVFTIFIAFVS